MVGLGLGYGRATVGSGLGYGRGTVSLSYVLVMLSNQSIFC